MTDFTASELFDKVNSMDSDGEDALCRFYLRLLKGETWSYQLRKENILLKEQSQEAYRKKLNKYVKLGFLQKGKKYYVDGKPRNPFIANLDVIRQIIRRYSFAEYEVDAAFATFKELTKDDVWVKSLDGKLFGKVKLGFFETLFPLIFMGPEISRFFFKLLFSSVSSNDSISCDKSNYNSVHELLMNVVENIELDISHIGADYVGKRFFLDIYLRDVMMLLYASGAEQKHWDLMKIAVLEDITVPLLTPQKHPNSPIRDYERFVKLSYSKRFDEIIAYIDSCRDHIVKTYYGDKWSQSLAAYIAYALTSSIKTPNPEIKGLLIHFQKEYGVTKKVVESVCAEIERKIEEHDERKATLLF